MSRHPHPRGPRPGRLSPGRIGLYLFLAVSAAFFLLPLYVMVVTSFKTMDQIRTGAIFALPWSLEWSNWQAAWSPTCAVGTCEGISTGFLNTVMITIPATIITVLTGALIGYTLSFWRVKGAQTLFALIVVAGFIPMQVFIYPLVRGLATVGLYGSLPGVVLMYVLFNLPLATLLFRNYFVSVPQELFQAARTDGAGFLRIFRSVMLPTATPMVAVASILVLTAVWNDFLIGLVFSGRDLQPMTVQLNNIVNTTTGTRLYNVNMAATLLTAIVPLVAYFLSGKWFVRGISAGAVKG